jgi:glycosyltransferase involved in cell wall biosynthesis
MKLLYVIPYEFYFEGLNNEIGGHTSHIFGVVEALIQKGYQIRIISDMPVPGLESRAIKYSAPALQSVRRLLRFLDRTLKYTDQNYKADTTSYYRSCTKLIIKSFVRRIDYCIFCIGLFQTVMRYSRRPKVSFIYYRHNKNGFIPAIVSKINCIPSVVEVNTPASLSTFYYGKKSNNNNEIKIHFREKLQYKLSNVISVVSPLIKDWIVTNVGRKYSEKIITNPNGVNPERFRIPQNPVSNIRTKYGIDPDAILIGMVAVFVKYNAIEELIEAFKRAKNRIDNMHLLLMGESHLRKDLETYTKNRHLSETVTFTGRIAYEMMPTYLASCDILVSHFNYDNILPHGCSIKHLEYMAMRKPVVATSIGYVNFAVKHNRNGLLVPQGDIDGFAQSIVKLSLDADLREKFGKQGRSDVEAFHSWDANIDRILHCLRRIN